MGRGDKRKVEKRKDRKKEEDETKEVCKEKRRKGSGPQQRVVQ